MQVGIDIKCMYTNFGVHDFSGFGDTTTLKMAKFPFLTMDYIVHGHQKFNLLESAQKIHASRD